MHPQPWRLCLDSAQLKSLAVSSMALSLWLSVSPLATCIALSFRNRIGAAGSGMLHTAAAAEMAAVMPCEAMRLVLNFESKATASVALLSNVGALR